MLKECLKTSERLWYLSVVFVCGKDVCGICSGAAAARP